MVRDTAETRWDTLKTRYDCGTIMVIWLLFCSSNGQYGFIISKSLVSTGILSSLGLPEHWPTSHRLNLHAVSQHRIYYIIHFSYQFSHFLFSKIIKCNRRVTIYLPLYLPPQMSIQPNLASSPPRSSAVAQNISSPSHRLSGHHIYTTTIN